MAAANNHILEIFMDRNPMKSAKKIFFFPPLISIIIITLISCASEFGQVAISRPDEYRHIYEASERIILNATARVFKDKNMGTNVRIDRKNNQVDSDFVTEGNWRTKSAVKVRKLNWKEREVVLAVTTEKKTENGWEMRRLLEKEQYINLFDKIDLAIYEEMSKIE